MSTRIKMARMFGAAVVTLALVPWLGMSPAAAGSDGHDKRDKGSRASKDRDHKSGRHDDNRRGNDNDTRKGKSDRSGKDRQDDDHKSDHRSEDKAKKSGHKSASKDGHKSSKDGHKSSKPGKGSHHKPKDYGDKCKYGHAYGKSKGKSCGHSTPTPKPTSTHGGGHHQKVTLCHRTGSEHHPYVRITVSIYSVVTAHGHDGHNGPIFQRGTENWGDIIPSFTYPTKGGGNATYGGKNWPAGKSIYDAWCKVPKPPTHTSTPTPTDTSTPTPTDTSTPTPTDTSTPTPTDTSTPAPTVTETVTQPGPTATVTETGDTSVLPTKIGSTGGDDTEVLGGRTGVLPKTGLGLPVAAALGLTLALLLGGGALMVVPGRLAKERNRRH